jgi:histidinol-phosphate aminotransferase
MAPTLENLLRPDIAALEAYTPVVPVEVLAERLGLPPERIVKLDANENPYGPSPRARAALAALGADAQALRSAIYPDPEHTALRRKLSAHISQPIERIVCGAGSDELIDLLMRLTLTPGSTMIDCPPTFGMYAFNAALHGARTHEISTSRASPRPPRRAESCSSCRPQTTRPATRLRAPMRSACSNSPCCLSSMRPTPSLPARA